LGTRRLKENASRGENKKLEGNPRLPEYSSVKEVQAVPADGVRQNSNRLLKRGGTALPAQNADWLPANRWGRKKSDTTTLTKEGAQSFGNRWVTGKIPRRTSDRKKHKPNKKTAKNSPHDGKEPGGSHGQAQGGGGGGTVQKKDQPVKNGTYEKAWFILWLLVEKGVVDQLGWRVQGNRRKSKGVRVRDSFLEDPMGDKERGANSQGRMKRASSSHRCETAMSSKTAKRYARERESMSSARPRRRPGQVQNLARSTVGRGNRRAIIKSPAQSKGGWAVRKESTRYPAQNPGSMRNELHSRRNAEKREIPKHCWLALPYEETKRRKGYGHQVYINLRYRRRARRSTLFLPANPQQDRRVDCSGNYPQRNQLSPFESHAERESN